MSMEVDQNAESYIARLLHRHWPPQSHHPHRRAHRIGDFGKAAAFSTLKADCVEWRADWFDAVSDVNALARCLHGLRAALGEKLLLVTFRTQAEGGEKPLAQEEYAAFCTTVCASGCADLLDIEFSPTERHCPPSLRRPTPPG